MQIQPPVCEITLLERLRRNRVHVEVLTWRIRRVVFVTVGSVREVRQRNVNGGVHGILPVCQPAGSEGTYFRDDPTARATYVSSQHLIVVDVVGVGILPANEIFLLLPRDVARPRARFPNIVLNGVISFGSARIGVGARNRSVVIDREIDRPCVDRNRRRYVYVTGSWSVDHNFGSARVVPSRTVISRRPNIPNARLIEREGSRLGGAVATAAYASLKRPMN